MSEKPSPISFVFEIWDEDLGEYIRDASSEVTQDILSKQGWNTEMGLNIKVSPGFGVVITRDSKNLERSEGVTIGITDVGTETVEYQVGNNILPHANDLQKTVYFNERFISGKDRTLSSVEFKDKTVENLQPVEKIRLSFPHLSAGSKNRSSN